MNNVAGRVILFVLAGALAGFFTWFISDGSGFIHLPDVVRPLTAREQTEYQVIFMTWGGSIGILLGLADALASGTLAQWPRILGIGLIVGVVAGVIGGAFGMAAFGPLYVTPAANPFDFLRNILARGLGWAFIGAFAGTASGWRKLSVRVGRNGLLGGLIGGILGGATFEIIPYLLPGIHAGSVSRFFGFLITGAMIGLFVALVSELLKEAWVKVIVGRNEGKEVLIEKQETKIGRAELSDIPLFGDTNIARTHALIVAMPGGQFSLRDVSASPVGVLLNDRPVPGEAPLRSGDRIQIASRLLVFYERVTREPTAPERRDVAAPARPAVPAGLPSLSDLPAAAPSPIPSPASRERGAYPVGASAIPLPPTASGTPLPRSGGGDGGGGETRNLRTTTGPYTGTAFPARVGAVIGRDAGADIALPADSGASRNHARLVAEPGGGLAVEDMGSTNGTFVNGRRITRQTLAPGDTVAVGGTSFRFE